MIVVLNNRPLGQPQSGICVCPCGKFPKQCSRYGLVHACSNAFLEDAIRASSMRDFYADTKLEKPSREIR